MEVTSTMSRLLLENMLPKHVVGIILNPKRKNDVQKLKKKIKKINFLFPGSLS